jgi:hypothetical protein
VSRTAGLISIAVFGVVMTGVFAGKFNANLQPLDLPPEARAALLAQTSRLATISIPEQLNDETKLAVRHAIEDSFISGFRVVILIASALALMSALFALLLIEGRTRPVKKAASAARPALKKAA